MRTEPKVLAAYLDDAEADLELAGAGIALGNRHAAFHLQQAAEKLVKAVRLHRGLLATKEHRIAVLVEGGLDGEPMKLPDDDRWHPQLLRLDALSDFATTYRYPTPSGRLKSPPDRAQLVEWATMLTVLIAQVRTELIGP